MANMAIDMQENFKNQSDLNKFTHDSLAKAAAEKEEQVKKIGELEKEVKRLTKGQPNSHGQRQAEEDEK